MLRGAPARPPEFCFWFGKKAVASPPSLWPNNYQLFAMQKNNYLRKAFSIHPLLVGGDPHTTTSIYALIHYLERKWGVFFCMGGTGKIVSELKKLALNKNLKNEMSFDSCLRVTRVMD